MNRKKRTIGFIIIQFFILFISLENVMAAPTNMYPYDITWSGKLSGAVQDSSGINNNQKRIVVCAYSCSDSNSGYKPGKCGDTGELWNTITYQSKETETNDWKINAGIVLNDLTFPSNNEITKHSILGAVTGKALIDTFAHMTMDKDISGTTIGPETIYVHEWKSIGVALPQTYYGASTNGDKNQDWQKDTQSYRNLYDSFVCPQYSYYDESATVKSSTAKGCDNNFCDNTMELCFADDTTSCSTRNEENYTTFNNANSLAFSFSEQLNSVLENMKNKINNMSDEEVLRPYGLPESEANSEEFLENICELLNQSQVNYQFSEGTDHEKEINRLIIDSYTELERGRTLGSSNKCGDGSNVTNVEEFEKCLKENNTIIPSYFNKEIYNFNDLSKLLVNGAGKEYKNVTYNNESMSEKFNDIVNNVYINRVKSATSSYQKQCEEKHGRKYALDVDQLGEDIKVSIDKIVTKYNIDLGDLNCDNIFADFADTIKTAYFFLEIGAIILAIALTALDYAKVILSDNQDEMKKTNQKLFKRLILVMVLFLLPAIINMTLRVFKIEGFDSKQPLCINVTEK